jgi:hypothetical protein
MSKIIKVSKFFYSHFFKFIFMTLDPSPSKTYSISLFRGSSINALVRDGVKTEPIACGFLACSLIFDEVGLTLENLGV